MEIETYPKFFEASVNTMQQRGYTTMNIENEEKSSPSSRGRHNAKLKVLVRSHAIREEASPPRESSPTHLISPSIQVIPTTEATPVVVLSPSLSRVTSPCLSPVCVSPTSTLVPSPTARSSPQNSPQHSNESNFDHRLNKHNLENDKRECASHHNNKQNCVRCKSQERNINNNVTTVNNNVQSSNTLTVNRVNSRNKLRQQSSSQGSFEGSLSNSPCLSRDSSSEQYTDTSGADLEVFIPETINRNAKDRAFMLRIEQELVSLAKDKSRSHYKFPPMSSYQRMLVHRCAAYFGMDHNIEASGKCVVVNKTKNTRIPEIEFKEHIKEDIIFSEEPRRSILKRDSNSIEDYSFKSPDRQYSLENRRSKSFEEREEEYAKVRRRIFNREELSLLRQMHDVGGSAEDFEWAEIHWSSTDSENSSRFRLQLPEHGRRQPGKLTKVLSEETGETARPYVAKSYSFGGYAGCLNRGDSVVSTHSAGPRLLTKQDSGASSVSWRLSPSSSGYKSQSQMSESITPSPTSTPNQLIGHCESTPRDAHLQELLNKDAVDSRQRFIWAVTDMHRVPKGSIIIDPQSGEPVKNSDGSIYRYDPENPPRLGMTGDATKPPLSPQKGQTLSPKRRGAKNSPTHRSQMSRSHVTNSSTSPSLPYSPPLLSQQQRFQLISAMGDGMLGQQCLIYGNGFSPQTHDVPFYQPPCIVYTSPYSVPISPHFENRIEPPPINEVPTTYFMNVSENNAPQPITYQQPPPFWNQPPIPFYQTPPSSNPAPPQRFPIHPPNQTNYISSFPQNYLSPTQAPPTVPPPTSDLIPVFHQQPMQLVYSQPNNQSNPNMMYQPNQSNFVYNQSYPPNPLYPFPYPQNTSTPNNCTTHGQLSSHDNVMQLTQNMSQLGFVQNHQQQQQQQTANYLANKATPPHFADLRPKNFTPKLNNTNKFGGRNFVLGSSQSSTGTNSPATTVVAGYCPQSTGMYRTPPETPPNQYQYGPGFPVPPMLLRQMSNVRANTPGTTRSSRSPTPASDISHFDRPRIPPPAVYPNVPYALPASRTQPNPYRHPPPVKQQSFGQVADHKTHKPRKAKGNRPSGLPNAK